MFYVKGFRQVRREPGFHLVSDNWNDYGFYNLYRLFKVEENLDEVEIGYVKIGHKGQEVGIVSLPSRFEELPEEYFSLGQSVEYYSKIRRFSPAERNECLTALKDVAYDSELYNEIQEEEVFKVSLMRDLNRKIVESQYRRIAHGGAILTDYEFEYQIDKETTLIFKVVPESLPPTNVHTIIGTNGAGKTTLLKGIRDGYLTSSLGEIFSNNIFISFSIFDKNGIYDKEDISREYYYVGVKKDEVNTKTSFELRDEFKTTIYNILSKKRYHNLQTMLEVLSVDNNLRNLDLINIINNFIETDQDKDNVEFYSRQITDIFFTLSSGHQLILLSISKIVELIVEKTLILIDEPETHLHPPLISAFVRALSEIIISENAVAILATHSPVVLQEVPKSCVSIIRKYGDSVKIEKPRFETFGENVGFLTEEVFGLDVPKTGFHSLLRKVVEMNPNYDEIIKLFNNELSIEAKAIVRTYINEVNKKER